MDSTATREVKTARLAPALLHKLAALLAATALLLVATSAAAQGSPNQPSGITVAGSGVAYGEPDQAVVNLGVDAVADNVRDALDSADAAMEAIRQAVMALGVEERDIRTVSFNVWRQQLTDQGGQPTGERYHVQHSFQVTVRDSALVGQVLADAVDAGANNVGGISFTISDTEALQREARAAAIADAQGRASQLAELAGVTLGEPIHVEETSYNAPMMAVAEAASYARGGGSPVQGGELAVNVTLRVTYAIADADDRAGEP